MAKTAVPIRSNGSATLRENGSVALVTPGESDCCCCTHCRSEDLCDSMADTPTTIRVTLADIVIRVETALYCDIFDFTTTVTNPDSYTGDTYCLEQDLVDPCRYVFQGVSPITITRSTGDIFDILDVIANITSTSTGIIARISSLTSGDVYFIHISSSSTPPLSCAAAQTLTGIDPYSGTAKNDCLFENAQEFVAADDYGTATVEACCVP